MKTKHTTTNPANKSTATTRGTTNRDINKGIKGNKTYKKVRNIWFCSIIKRKGNSYRAGNISSYYGNWRSIISDKYILSTEENSLLLSFDKDQPCRALFEFPRTKAETNVLETEVESII